MTRKVSLALLVLLACMSFATTGNLLVADDLADAEKTLADQHPWPSYRDVEDIGAVEAALRKAFAGQSKQSFSRGWWIWDRLRCRYVDEGRRDRNVLHVLRAVFRGWILDWHAKLAAKGEADLFYIFFTTAPGDKKAKETDDGRTLVRDVHGGGYAL